MLPLLFDFSALLLVVFVPQLIGETDMMLEGHIISTI